MSDVAQFAHAAARGDAAALEQLIRAGSQGVYAFLLAMLGDPRQADEGLQETYVRMTRSLGRLEPDSDVEAWSYAIARRVAADVEPSGVIADGARPELARLVRVPFHHREVLVLHDVLGWEDARTAALLETTPEDIRQRLVAAREAIVGPARAVAEV